MADEDDNELVHYGVKGMRWGVRRASLRRNASADHKEARNLKKRHISELSNVELRTLNNRRQLENQYKQLNPNTLQIGKKHVAAALATAGTVAAIIKVAKGPVGKATAEAGKAIVMKTMENKGRHVLINTVTSRARHLA